MYALEIVKGIQHVFTLLPLAILYFSGIVTCIISCCNWDMFAINESKKLNP